MSTERDRPPSGGQEDTRTERQRHEDRKTGKKDTRTERQKTERHKDRKTKDRKTQGQKDKRQKDIRTEMKAVDGTDLQDLLGLSQNLSLRDR